VCSSPLHGIMIIICHRIRRIGCIFNYTIASYRIASGSTGSSARGSGKAARVDPQETQAQEVPEVEEQEEDLPECVDHQPSSFERGKP
jgi:hypothetical protein